MATPGSQNLSHTDVEQYPATNTYKNFASNLMLIKKPLHNCTACNCTDLLHPLGGMGQHGLEGYPWGQSAMLRELVQSVGEEGGEEDLVVGEFTGCVGVRG